MVFPAEASYSNKRNMSDVLPIIHSLHHSIEVSPCVKRTIRDEGCPMEERKEEVSAPTYTLT
eukprot:6665287-Karenia_brevis.AAC.1